MSSQIIASKTLLAATRWDAPFFFMSEDRLSSIYDTVELLNVIKERKGFIEPQRFPSRLFNYVGLENISQKTRLLTEFQPKLGIEIKSRSKVYRQGDILYGRMRPTLNKVLEIGPELKEGICSTEIFVFSPLSNRINSVYLGEILTSRWVQSEIERIVGGATMPRINIKDFLQIHIPLPPLEIQAQIADFISNERSKFLKQLNYTSVSPLLIQGAVLDFISGNSEMKIQSKVESKEFWNNPLPDMEL